MCDFLVLMVPESADIAHAMAVARDLGFAPERRLDHEPHLPDVWQGAVLLDPEGLQCYCGSSLGRAYRDPKDRSKLEQMASRGRRARWSDAKRRKWIEQQMAPIGGATELSPGADQEIDRWLALAQAAAGDGRIGRIGVVLTAFDETVADWAPSATAGASRSSLQLLAPRTPTWLV